MCTSVLVPGIISQISIYQVQCRFVFNVLILWYCFIGLTLPPQWNVSYFIVRQKTNKEQHFIMMTNDVNERKWIEALWKTLDRVF